MATTLKPQAMNDTTRLSSKVITATRDMTAASGDVSYTGVGFVPTSMVIIASVDGAFGFSSAVVDSIKTGVSILTTGIGIFGHNDLAVCLFVTNTSNVQFCAVKSFDADGFTLTWTKGGSPIGTGLLKFLCFR